MNYRLSRIENLISIGDCSFFAIWDGAVNLEDLLHLKPGGIVRCFTQPDEALKQFTTTSPDPIIGCIAGWLCDDEETTC